VDEKGVITYNFPQTNSVGKDISQQKHVREILATHQPVISDVFRAVEGFDAIAVYAPVFKGSEFKGSIAILVNFESLAHRYLDVVKTGQTGYAWVISRDGTILYTPVAGYVGKSELEVVSNAPSLRGMVDEMLQGHAGAASYTFDRIGDQIVAPTKKYAVYMPVRIGNTFWSIAVTSAEQDILSNLISFRNKLIIIIGAIFLIGMVFSAFAARAWLIVKEEAKLKESEKRLLLATDAANLGIWIRDLVRDEVWASDKWRTLFGFTKSERIDLNGYLQKLHPEDRVDVRQTLAKALSSDGHYETEYRVLLPDGQLRWIASRGRVEFNAAEQPVLVRGTSLDITPRKLAEEAARNLSGRLIRAQEDERRRIARDLHDDLSQRLALLSVELELFGQKPPTQSEAIAGRMLEFSGIVKHLSSDIHRLAHELHPAKLSQLGLATAVRGLCKELAAAHQLAIEFESRDVPRTLPDDVALCLYRITQEALQNVIKHSGAVSARVELAAHENRLQLSITDDGHGFEPAAAPANGTLGLVSMRERVRMVQGQIGVNSRPGAGTQIEVSVPLRIAADAPQM
jgi:PAS domain S-box-containing protein